MTEKESKLVDEFLDLAKENRYCEIVCFTMGALAFNKGTDEEKTIEILNDLIVLAKKYPKEEDFTKQVSDKYFED